MPKVFMYVPFARTLVDGAKDAYFDGMIKAFKAAGHPPEHLIYPAARCTWEKTPRRGDSEFVTNIEESAEVHSVWSRMFARSPKAGEKKFLKDVRRASGGPLRAVDASDMLFVVGHSSYTGGYLSLKALRGTGSSKVADRYSIRADALAELLAADGLSRQHKFIKLNSCYGGGSDELDRALAKDIAIQLKTRFYFPSVIVGGYQYLTMVGQTGKLSIAAPMEPTEGASESRDLAKLEKMFAVSSNPPSRELLFEKDPYRCWYDGNGNCVRWNVPDGYYGSSEHFTEGNVDYKLIPLLSPKDPHYGKWRRKKDDEAAWIAAMERVEAAARSR